MNGFGHAIRCKRLILVVIAALTLNAPGLVNADSEKISLAIKSQKMGSALMELSAQTGVHIMLPQSAGDSVRFAGIQGEYTLRAALDEMLQNSGLAYEFVSDDSVLIKKVEVGNNERSVEDGKKGIIEEMIVTAQKRATSLQDTPLAISAMGSEEVEQRGILGMGDYLNSIPGVTQANWGTGKNIIVMRGIAAGATDESSVGVYLGEVPLSGIADVSSTDARTVDIERIEVLRGPQGTLYGSGSMAGAVRTIPAAPDLENFIAKGTVGYSQTSGGGGNNKATAILNLPIQADHLALRIAAYNFDDEGYVDNVGASDPSKSALAATYGALLVDEQNVGDVQAQGVRASVLWRPTDRFDVTLTYARDKQTQIGYNEVDSTVEAARGGKYFAAPFSLAPANISGGNETQKEDIEIVNAVANYDFGPITAVSSTSWFSADMDETRDAGRVIPFPLPQAFDAAKSGWVQELRLVSDFEGSFQFTGGVYYDDLKRHSDSSLFWGGTLAANPFGLTALSDPLFVSEVNWNIKQKAIFGEVSNDFTDALKLTLGGRLFEYRRVNNNHQAGPLAGAGVDLIDDTSQSGDSLKANLSYTPNDDGLLYAQWAQGFRVGQGTSSAAPAGVCDLNNDGLLDGTSVSINPGVLKSDTLDSYEIGSKFSLLDSRVTLALAAYHIDWDGIPVTVVAVPNCGFVVKTNAGKATSDGIEIESDIQLSDSFSLSLAGSYLDAKLARSGPLGAKGTRLPSAAKVNLFAAARYEFEAFGYPSFARLDANYVSKFHNDIARSFEEAGGYTTVNLRTGIKRGSVSIDLYANNLTNTDQVAYTLITHRSYRLRPRTIGIELGYEF